jgi:hypothetical protein
MLQGSGRAEVLSEIHTEFAGIAQDKPTNAAFLSWLGWYYYRMERNIARSIEMLEIATTYDGSDLWLYIGWIRSIHKKAICVHK